MRETAPYQLVSHFGENANFALKSEDVESPSEADSDASDSYFAFIAAQPNLRDESSDFLVKAQDPFAQEAGLSEQPVSRDENEPLTASSPHDPLSNAGKSPEHVLSTPPNNTTNNNPQNLGGVGQGPGGASTTNPSGGGVSGGSSGGPAGGNLAALANEGAFGTPIAPQAGRSASSAPSATAPAETTNTNPRVSPAPIIRPMLSPNAGTTHLLSGSGQNFTAQEAGLGTNQWAAYVTAVSPLVQGTAGAAFTNATVATFADPDPNSTASDFTASINWGDNTASSTGTVAAVSSGGFSVAGSHTYAAAGTYTLTVTITDVPTGKTAGGATGTAVVQDASMTAAAVSINATENSAANNVTVATFTSTNSLAPASTFSANIDWGDGSTSTGTVTGSNGNFTVAGSHTYTEGGTYQVSVTITSSGGSSAATASTATVTDLSLTGTSLTLTPAPTGSSTNLADAFTDANTSENSSNYLAQINWGDSWIDDVSVSGASGSYSLSGSHVYDHPGTYTVTVTVTDAGGSTLTQTASTTSTAAALSASGTTLTAIAGQALSNAQIATFTDGNTDQMNDWYGPASGYTTSINWGDGTAADTSATVNGDENGFYVIGNHTYSSSGAYTVSVTITNADGVSTTATSTIDVTTITPTGATFSASEGVAANNVAVATFTDSQSSTYTASIDWGDGGTPTTGTVSGSGGSYTVTGSHTYSDGGTYPVTTTITNSAGLIAVATGTANVADAALTATPQNVTVAANSPLNATLATFTDANTKDPLASYSASIDWGDGRPTDVGTITYANGVYTVTGSHTYTSQGSYTATVYIGDAGGATTTASSTVTVTAPVINATAVSLSAQEGVLLNNVTVATFTAPGAASAYSATVDWGDGNSSTGTITGSGGNFSVLASNTYEEQTGGQQFAITVTITDAANDTATVISTATVDTGAMSASGASPQGTEGASSTFTLATITDTDPSYAASEFTALVNWGDGSNPDFATISGTNGTYNVLDSHTYAEDGSYTATITITEPNNLTTQTVYATISVVDAALSAGGESSIAALTVTQGIAANAIHVTQFVDANASEAPGTFTASINWGDGSSATPGVVGGAGGVYSVSGSHTYPNVGYNTSYTATITITDPGGKSVVLTTPVTSDVPPTYETATFTDSNTSDTANMFSASIDWGDGSTTGGTVYGSAGSFAVFGVHAYAEEGTYTVTTTITGPGGTIVLTSTATVTDPSVNGSQSPPAPPQVAQPAATVPSITFNFGSAEKNKIAQSQPGLRIHIDDDFYMRAVLPGFNASELADYRINWIDSNKDQNLVEGTITVGPAKSMGTLSWMIPNSVRVFWQPNKDGSWQLVKSGSNLQINPNISGVAIPIAIQGITPDGGPAALITATYTITTQGQKRSESKNFYYNVYTGLKVVGDANPQQEFLQQLQQATTYSFTNDSSGNVWRTSRTIAPGSYGFAPTLGYRGTFMSYFDNILRNPDYGLYQKEISTTTLTAVATTPGLSPWFPDDETTKRVFPDNIAALTTGKWGIGMPNAPTYAAGIIAHILQEFYQREVLNVQFEMDTKPVSGLDHDHGGAFGSGVAVEEYVTNWGDRKTVGPKTSPVLGSAFVAYMFEDRNTGKVSTVKVMFVLANNAFETATVTRPGQ